MSASGETTPNGQPQGSDGLNPVAKQLSAEEKEEKFHQSNPLWKDLMRNMKCHIDNYILRILDVTGYKSYHTLKKITDQSIDTMEAFVKGDGILSRVDVVDLELYLGPVKKREMFSFLPGERELILGIAEFVKNNHVEPKVPLGKVSHFPIFKRSASGKHHGSSEEPDAKKKRDLKKVVSFDMHAQVSKIRKLVHDHCVKKKFPKEIIAALSRIQVDVKTVELQRENVDDDFEMQQTGTLSAKLLCPFCKKHQSCTYNSKGYWITSNMHRHLNQHVTNGDFKNQTSLNWPCTSKSDGNSLSEENNSENETVETISDSDDLNLDGGTEDNIHVDGLLSTSKDYHSESSSPATNLDHSGINGTNNLQSGNEEPILKQAGIQNF